MKKMIFLLLTAISLSAAVYAQPGGGFQRQTPEERTKATMEKMAPLNLDAEAKAKTEIIISEFNTASQKAMTELRESGADRETMMAKRKELSDARDGKLKLVFTETQMKQWKDEIEPSLRPQRPGGGGN